MPKKLPVPGRTLEFDRFKIDRMVERTPFQITMFDTAAGSPNLGDEIITNAVRRTLEQLFPQAHLWTMPTHDTFGELGRRKLQASLFSIACGTNLLSRDFPSNASWSVPRRLHWGVNPYDFVYPRNLVMCAVGSNAQPLEAKAVRFLNRSVWKKIPVSARDNATVDILNRAGLPNSVHTSCVTLWDLPEGHDTMIAKTRAENVVIALTGKRRANSEYAEYDRKLVEYLLKTHKHVYFWPQGATDFEYFLSLQISGCHILNHSLASFTEILKTNHSIEYVGSRLHAGIHALMHNKRAIVVAIDNRAEDITQSIALPVVRHGNFDEVEAKIQSGWVTSLNLPRASIQQWKQLFVEAVRSQLSARLDLSAFLPRTR